MYDNEYHFDLINAANIESGLLDKNFIASAGEFKDFDTGLMGIPILIAANQTIFDFDATDEFDLSPNELCASIYQHCDLNYVGFKHAFHSCKFLSNFKVKPIFQLAFENIVKQNKDCKIKIDELKDKYGKVGAFQTRNIPHAGHEAIISRMLEKCDHLVINPVVGPKKKGDVLLDTLQYVYNELAARKYKQKISFLPIIANMFYAGPKEAIHHALLRQTLGFDLFSVGRDHAGAEGYYEADAAIKLVSENAKTLNIAIYTHKGAAYCTGCEKILVVGECDCNLSFLHDISGSEFRNSINKNNIYPFADLKMQKHLFDYTGEFFVND